MKEELKYIVIDALTSGQYKQGKGFMRNPEKNTYCIAGVITDLYHQITGKGKWVDEKFKTEYYSSTATLVPEVQEWIGMKEWCNYDCNGGNQLLITDNDTGKSFKELAEIIYERF